MMKDITPVSDLDGVEFLFPNDLGELAEFLLKAYDAKYKGTSTKARPTLHGLATAYSRLCDVDPEAVLVLLQKQRFRLGNVIEWD